MMFFAKEGAANVVVVTVLLKYEILKTSVVLKTLRSQEQGTKSEVSYIYVLGFKTVIFNKFVLIFLQEIKLKLIIN